MSSNKPIVGYWDIRGRAEPIRLLLVSQGVDFEDRRYKRSGNNTTEQEDWFAVKNTLGFDFPNIPYLIDGDVRLTQTLAILRYLGRKYNLSGETESERNRIAVLEQQVVDLLNEVMGGVLRASDFESARADYLANKLPDRLEQLARFLGDGQWVSGASMSYVDFFLYEYLAWMSRFAPEVFARHPSLQRVLDRVNSLPKVAKYRSRTGPQLFLPEGLKWTDRY